MVKLGGVNHTTITISKKMHRRIKALKKGGESFTQLFERLLFASPTDIEKEYGDKEEMKIERETSSCEINW